MSLVKKMTLNCIPSHVVALAISTMLRPMQDYISRGPTVSLVVRHGHGVFDATVHHKYHGGTLTACKVYHFLPRMR